MRMQCSTVLKTLLTTVYSGFFWDCGMLNTERFCCSVLWDDTQLDTREIDGYVSKLFEIIGWITNAENWNVPVSILQGFPKMTLK